MKRFLVSLLISSCISIAISFVVLKLVLPKWIKTQIETKGSEIVGAPVTVQKVEIHAFPAIEVHLLQLKTELKMPPVQVNLPLVRLRIPITARFLKREIPLELDFEKPQTRLTWLEIPDPAAPPPAKPEEAGQINTYKIDLPFKPDFKVRVLDGLFEIIKKGYKGETSSELRLKNLNFAWGFYGLNIPWDFESKFELDKTDSHIEALPVETKLQVTTNFETATITVQKSAIKVAGVLVAVAGSWDRLQQNQDWNAQVEISELSQIPELKNYFKFGTLSGSLTGKLKATNSVGEPWKGDFETTANLQKTSLLMLPWIDKKPNVPFKIYMKGLFVDKGVQLQTFETQLASLNLKASGDISLSAPSNLNFSTPPTSISSLNSVFPWLESQGAAGFFQMTANFRGKISEPQKGSVSVEQFQISQATLPLKFVSKEYQVTGPLNFHAKATGVYEAEKLQNARAEISADFSQGTILIPKTFFKNKGQKLAVKINAGMQGSALNIDQGTLETAAGNVNLGGRIAVQKATAINLKVGSEKISLHMLASHFAKDLIPQVQGTWSGNMRIQGSWDGEKGWKKSPLAAFGKQTFTLDKYAYNPPQTQSVDAKEHGGDKTPETTSPGWTEYLQIPLLRQSNFETNIKIKNVAWRKFQFQNFAAQLTLANGAVTASSQTQSTDGGKMNLSSLKANLIESNPKAVFQAIATKIQLQPYIEYFLPKWKESFSGQSDLKLTGETLLLSKNPLEGFKVHGDIKISQAHLKVAQFEKILKQKLASIPVIGSKISPQLEDIRANFFSKFNFEHQKLQLSELQLLTSKQDELKAQGEVSLDEKIQWDAQAFLAQAPVQGSFREANSDGKGRLVVPLKLQGTLSDPQVSILDETIAAMTKKTLDYEKVRAQKQLQSQVKQEVEKKKTELESKVKKEATGLIKDLFKVK